MQGLGDKGSPGFMPQSQRLTRFPLRMNFLSFLQKIRPQCLGFLIAIMTVFIEIS